MGKIGKNSAWNLIKVRSEKEVIDEARTTGAKVHFASLRERDTDLDDSRWVT